MIDLRPSDDRGQALWEALLDIARRQPEGWTLIGAQMVALLGFEHGRQAPRASLDGDMLVDVRVLPDGTRRLSRVLEDAGFELTEITTDGRGHRFSNGQVLVDVLAPDGLGPRTDLTTVAPARTIQVPGGSQALARTERVEVRMGATTGILPRPDLLGALLVKCRAVDVDDAPDNQRRDVAFLLSLTRDPRTLASQLRRGERTPLRRRGELLDPSHLAWTGVQNADDGRLALRILGGISRKDSSPVESAVPRQARSSARRVLIRGVEVELR